MGTKIILTFLCFTMTSMVFALDTLEVNESGKVIKLYALENEVMVHSATGKAPQRVRTNLRSTRRVNPGDKVSEIFSDRPNGSGQLRSLPGGIVVKLADGADAAQWAEDNGLVLKKQLSNGMIMIESSAGRSTLTKVEEIAEMDGVEKVMPNWWTNVKPKTSVKERRIPSSIKSSFNRN